MTDPETPDEAGFEVYRHEPERRQLPRLGRKRSGCLLVAAVLFLAFIGFGFLVQVPILLVSGWAFFLWREVPGLVPDWPMLISGIAAAAGFLAGLHLLLVRCLHQRGATWWSRPHSLAVGGLILGGGVAGIALICAVHQAAWLARGDFGMTDAFGGRNAVSIGLEIWDHLDKADDHSTSLALDAFRRHAPHLLASGQQIHFVTGPDGTVVAVVCDRGKGTLLCWHRDADGSGTARKMLERSELAAWAHAVGQGRDPAAEWPPIEVIP